MRREVFNSKHAERTQAQKAHKVGTVVLTTNVHIMEYVVIGVHCCAHHKTAVYTARFDEDCWAQV